MKADRTKSPHLGISTKTFVQIERTFPPGSTRPAFDIPRFWSEPDLNDPEKIIALVLAKPTDDDLTRTILAYGPRKVIAVFNRIAASGDLPQRYAEHVRQTLPLIIKGIARAAR